MSYYLYKLKFPYGVHFGKVGVGLEKTSVNCHCDTFYSAICHEILKLYGEKGVQEFYTSTKNGEFLLSDLLPYDSQDLYIPKPILYKERNEDIQATDSVMKKRMKKLEFIPISKITEYFNGEVEDVKFLENMIYEKNAISRDGDDNKNGLYSVGVTRFYDGCGLYFVVQIGNDKVEWFDNIIKSLALSGIGGKRTSGYGQFDIEDNIELEETSPIEYEKNMAKLLNQKGEYYLTLSVFYPRREEISNLKNGYYSLIQRQGFVQSVTYNDKLLKKIPVTMINSGSCFEQKFEGDIIDVSKSGNHPIYRYGKPIMIGINA